ncbi:MAG: Asp-tRNA(Asn)/Glu-tRNA(Gln) amidotransferase subunit GatC, partial [Patescibacteria group bacterium]
LNKYANQLSQILGYIDQLNEVDTAGVEPASQVTGLTNVFREDKIEKCAVIDDLLAQAPETEKGGVKVKSVF